MREREHAISRLPCYCAYRISIRGEKGRRGSSTRETPCFRLASVVLSAQTTHGPPSRARLFHSGTFISGEIAKPPGRVRVDVGTRERASVI